jgi:hypothetical protein
MKMNTKMNKTFVRQNQKEYLFGNTHGYGVFLSGNSDSFIPIYAQPINTVVSLINEYLGISRLRGAGPYIVHKYAVFSVKELGARAKKTQKLKNTTDGTQQDDSPQGLKYT